MRPLTFGTRSSALARWQTGFIQRGLETQWPGLETRQVLIQTEGDRELDLPLPEIGGKGLFTLELEQALREGRIDVAVHSLKDLPIDAADGLVIGLIPAREYAHDVLVAGEAQTLEQLPPASIVGTSSLRRQGQLLAYRPDLQVKPLRGNLQTRLRKLDQGEFDAIILAEAGLVRLDLGARITQRLPYELMLPAPGQGALAVQCRQDDRETLCHLAALDHSSTRAEVQAERSFLQALGGGCSLPVGALAEQGDAGLLLRGVVISPDGGQRIAVKASGTDPAILGAALAAEALGQGAERVLHG
jgi:hydroxymethylbilane synthase